MLYGIWFLGHEVWTAPKTLKTGSSDENVRSVLIILCNESNSVLWRRTPHGFLVRRPATEIEKRVTFSVNKSQSLLAHGKQALRLLLLDARLAPAIGRGAASLRGRARPRRAAGPSFLPQLRGRAFGSSLFVAKAVPLAGGYHGGEHDATSLSSAAAVRSPARADRSGGIHHWFHFSGSMPQYGKGYLDTAVDAFARHLCIDGRALG